MKQPRVRDDETSAEYEPGGADRRERNRHRARGWTAAFAVGLLVWAAVAGGIALVAALLR
jgi:hypothetical protein